ncbi:MAG: radical SAM protein, partial [Dictyoglomi bacterium]|nr:radical SAM protein [Dictyoglomota bacterium]
MEIIHKVPSSVSTVYIGYTDKGNLVEFVESRPTRDAKSKWVVIISSLIGCPVGCKMCDAGFFYNGKLDTDELISQVEYAVNDVWHGKPDTKKFKVQFARMGEPSFNMAVIDAMLWLKDKYDNFFPSLSTVAPIGTDAFFERLIQVKKEHFPHNFQMQFSIHSTDTNQRNEIIPIKKWDFEKIADFGREFYDEGGLKITLNFALAQENKA